MFKLQDLRDRRRIKLLGYVFFVLLIISFVFFYGWQSGDQNKGYKTTVTLGKMKNPEGGLSGQWEEIGSENLREAKDAVRNKYMMNLPENYVQYYDSQSPNRTARLIDSMTGENEAIEELANLRLLGYYANELDFQLPKDQVKRYLKANNPNLTDQALDYLAAHNGMTRAQYIERFRQDLQNSQMLEIVGLTAQTSLYELWQEYSLAHEKLTLKLAAFPSKDFEDQVVISEAQLQDYLDAHQEQFRATAKRRYAYVKKTAQEIKEELNPSDDDLKAFYEQNQIKYLRPAGFLTEDIYIPLTGDISSSAATEMMTAERAAVEASDDWNALVERLKEKHPDFQIYYHKPLNYLTADSALRSEDYRKAMEKLAVDETSKPLVDENGAYLFRVKDRRSEGVAPLDEIGEKVLNDYRLANTEDATATLYRKMLEELATAGHTTMQSFAQAVGLEDDLTTRVERNAGYLPDVGSVVRNLDHLRGLKVNEFSDPILLQDGSLTVLQLIEETEEYDPELSEIRSEVEKALRAEKAAEVAQASADQTLTLLEGGAPFDQALANAPIKPRQTDPVERTDNIDALDSPLIEFIEQTPSIDKGSRGVTPYGFDKDHIDGYAVWEVVELEPASRKMFEEDLPVFRRDYRAMQRETLKREWLNNRRKELGFEITVPVQE